MNAPKPMKTASLSDRILAIEVFSELLAATAPSMLGKRLTEQVRELSGAKTILLAAHVHDEVGSPLLHACPSRRSGMFTPEELRLLCPHQVPGEVPSLVADIPDGHPWRALLARVGVESILRVPLHGAGELVGSLILLDLPEPHRIAETRDLLSHLAPTIALALKNTLAYERIESQARELEKQAQELERRVAERTAELATANSALEREKERLSVTLRSIADGVITTDTGSRILTMNKAAEELTSWTQAEAAGKPIADVFRLIDVSSRQSLSCPVKRALETGTVVEWDQGIILLSRDGAERAVAQISSPIRDPKSEIIGVVLVFRDMTEKLKLADALQRNDKLDALGVLAGGIAHDFNNLLAGIFGYIDLARESCGSDAEETLDSLNQAMRVFERAKGLTQQLLTFSKGGLPARKTGEVATVVRESASFALSGSNITPEFKVASDIWLVDFDRNQIGQVIDNLVINARQAMPTGGRLTIFVENRTLGEGEKPDLKAGRYVRIAIADMGMGIPPAHLKRIFDPFFTTKQKGTGLGLATCYGIVQKHQGCIEVESTLGKGSTFSVYLPASTGQAMSGTASGGVSHLGSGTVLIMDDEPFIRQILVRMLEGMGYRTLEACEGDEASKIASEAIRNGTKITAAIFDLTVPGGKGGREAVAELHRLCAGIPVFASSGYSEDPVMSDPVAFGFVASIRKPYRRDELAGMFERHLGRPS